MGAVTRELPTRLYRAAGVRALDRAAIEGCGIPGAELMERAGGAAWSVLRRTWPRARRLLVLAGTGNNGGDGYVLARRARMAGYTVVVVQLGEYERLRGDARLHAERARAAGVPLVPYTGALPDGFDVAADAMLGTGLDREVAGVWRAAIEALAGTGLPVLAIDVPSGLDADRGTVHGVAVRAAATVTFIGLKRGLVTGAAADHTGTLWFADLDVPQAVYERVPADGELLDAGAECARLDPRRRTAHKGEHGHVLIVGGDHGYIGAARMAAEAAARAGAGLVSVATRAGHAPQIAAVRPELMAHGVEDRAGLAVLAERATVVAIGPGLGRGAWGVAMLAALLERRGPLVLDADALNLLAAEPVRREDWVLTPHPGEAARLLGIRSAEVQADRFAAAEAIRERYGGVCVLKGAGTVIAAAGALPAVCRAGNPGMASGGMGDVLTGLIAGLLAQGLAPAAAARLGVCVHAAAADAAAAADGERGLLATDLLPYVRRLLNPPRS